jgi:HlyD family secretion protein
MRAAIARLPRGVRLAAVTVVVAGAGFWALFGRSPSEDADWVRVARDDLVLGVEVTGSLEAVDSSAISPPQVRETWNYKIAMMAPEGAQVKKGQPVLGFDTSELTRKLDQKVAEAASAAKQMEKKQVDITLRRREDELRLAEAEARERKAAMKVDRPPELAAASELRQARLDLGLARDEIAYVKKRTESATQADEAELSSLRNQRDLAEGRVKEIRESIERMTVGAPRDGTVIYVTDWREEKKKVGDSCWRAERVLEIPDLRSVIAKGQVDEVDAGKIAVGQKVAFRLDAHPDVEFAGRISSIWKTVQRQSYQNPLKVVRLDVTLDRTDTVRMRPGMRFRGTVETGRVPRAVVIPSEAVFPTPEGPVAWRKTVLGHEAVALTLGRRNDKLVEVLGGLEEGDQVARRDLGARRVPA